MAVEGFGKAKLFEFFEGGPVEIDFVLEVCDVVVVVALRFIQDMPVGVLSIASAVVEMRVWPWLVLPGVFLSCSSRSWFYSVWFSSLRLYR